MSYYIMLVSPYKNITQYSKIQIKPNQMNSDIQNIIKLVLRKYQDSDLESGPKWHRLIVRLLLIVRPKSYVNKREEQREILAELRLVST